MVDFRSVYQHAEDNVNGYVITLFVLLAFAILGQSFVSANVILAGVLAVLFGVLSVRRPLVSLAVLAAYLPFESFILKFVPDEIYVFARYFPELLIYALCAIVAWRILVTHRGAKMRPTVLDLPIALFVLVLISSAIINLVPPSIAILGSRQILRFVLVFFLAVYLAPSKTWIKQFTLFMCFLAALQAGIGLIQAAVGGPLDTLLLPSDARTLGDITLTAGVDQFWDPGSRIFATLGRYDRLGNYLYIFLLLAFPFFYEPKLKSERSVAFWLFLLGLPALVLTYSRASWFAFLIGFLFIGAWVYKDRRVSIAFLLFSLVAGGYIFISGLNVRYLTEAPGQGLVERFYEAFSYSRWRGEYEGLGRVFWFVQTPATVVAASPLFGFGPGQYGGGAVAALSNTKVYETLGLPFGVYGTDGYIDNNWFSLWGESGTLGMFFYLWAYAALFFYTLNLARTTKDPFIRALAFGYAAVMMGVAFNAFTSTLLEIRTVAFYLWLYGGFLITLGSTKKEASGESPAHGLIVEVSSSLGEGL